jgi:hypothetical protein
LSKTSLHILPSLDDLVADPSKVKDLSGDECQTMLIKLATAQTLLLGRILSFNGKPESVKEDTLLTAKQAAERLGCTPDWLYRHKKRTPLHSAIKPPSTAILFQRNHPIFGEQGKLIQLFY